MRRRMWLLLTGTLVVAGGCPLILGAEAPIFRAIERADLEAVQKLVEANPKIVHAQSERQGATPLHWAVSRAAGGVQTAARRAEAFPAICRLLLEQGADPGARDLNGETPVDWAIVHRASDAVQAILREHGGDFTRVSLVAAAHRGDAERVARLLEQAPPPADRLKRRALDRAIIAGRADMVKRLLESGLDPNGPHEDTPLHRAARQGQTECTILLLVHGADMGRKNGYGRTPLRAAALDNQRETAMCLIVNGATPGFLEAVSLGLTCRLDVLLGRDRSLLQQKSAIGWTPLYLAAVNGHLDAVKLLVERYGCDVEVRNTNGETALVVAASHGHEAVMEYLLEHGAAITPAVVRRTRQKGRSALADELQRRMELGGR